MSKTITLMWSHGNTSGLHPPSLKPMEFTAIRVPLRWFMGNLVSCRTELGPDAMSTGFEGGTSNSTLSLQMVSSHVIADDLTSHA